MACKRFQSLLRTIGFAAFSLWILYPTPVLAQGFGPETTHARPLKTDAAAEELSAATDLLQAGQYSAACDAYKTLLSHLEASGSAEDWIYPTAMLGRGICLKDLAIHGEAETILVNAARKFEELYGIHDAGLAVAYNNLGLVYLGTSRLDEASESFSKSLEIKIASGGEDNPATAGVLLNLGLLKEKTGQYQEALKYFDDAFHLARDTNGPKSLAVADSLLGIARIRNRQGRYSRAQSLLREVLEIQKSLLGASHPTIAATLNEIGAVELYRGNLDLAEGLLQTALGIAEKTLPDGHPTILSIQSNLSEVLVLSLNFDEAESTLLTALQHAEDRIPQDPDELASIYQAIAQLHLRKGDFEEARGFSELSLNFAEKLYTDAHPLVSRAILSLATLSQKTGNSRAAVALLTRALEAGPISGGDLWSAQLINEAAKIALELGDIPEAWRLSNGAVGGAAAQFLNKSFDWETAFSRDRKAIREIYETNLLLSQNAFEHGLIDYDEFVQRSFEVAQRLNADTVSKSFLKAQARKIFADEKLRELLHELEVGNQKLWRLNRSWATSLISTSFGDSVSSSDTASIVDEIRTTQSRHSQMFAQIEAQFPKYWALSQAVPLALVDAKSALSPGEALVKFIVLDETVFAWTIQPDEANLNVIDLSRSALNEMIVRLRQGIDLSNVDRPIDVPPFDLELAHLLYQALWRPLEDGVRGAEHILVVSDDSLRSLPFSLLVTEEAEGKRYSDVNWLLYKYAIGILPDVANLRWADSGRQEFVAQEPFIGFGDPLLDSSRSVDEQRRVSSLVVRGQVVDTTKLFEFPALPSTSEELFSIAEALGAKTKDVYLQERASETSVKSANLNNYRILAFATHALVAGELDGLNEPGLLLSAPTIPSVGDDGFLSSSEVAGLRLNTELVVLSACNTASPDGSLGAPGLSGLAQAFLFAGTEAVLVSHWAVDSGAAAELTVNLIKDVESGSTTTYAEALQKSMLKMVRNSEKNPYYAHPAFWAPFSLIGRG